MPMPMNSKPKPMKIWPMSRLRGDLMNTNSTAPTKRQNGRERGGLKEFHQHAAARNIGKPDDLARHRGADVGAHDDADGLGKLHDARVGQGPPQ